MASVNGVNMALVALNKKAGVGDVSGSVKHLHDSYVFTANVFAAADTIKIGTVPKGARFVGGYISAPDLGTTGSFSLGTLAIPAGIVPITAFTAAAGNSAQAATGLLVGSVAAADVDIYISCTTATDAANGLQIDAGVLYVKA